MRLLELPSPDSLAPCKANAKILSKFDADSIRVIEFQFVLYIGTGALRLDVVAPEPGGPSGSRERDACIPF